MDRDMGDEGLLLGDGEVEEVEWISLVGMARTEDIANEGKESINGTPYIYPSLARDSVGLLLHLGLYFRS